MRSAITVSVALMLLFPFASLTHAEARGELVASVEVKNGQSEHFSLDNVVDSGKLTFEFTDGVSGATMTMARYKKYKMRSNTHKDEYTGLRNGDSRNARDYRKTGKRLIMVGDAKQSGWVNIYYQR